MKILISGQHLSIGDSLKAHIEQRVDKYVKKYFEHATTAHVTLIKEKSYIRTEIMINQGTGSDVIIKSTGEDNDAYRSFDVALQKADQQLRKHKARIKNHHKDKEKRAFLKAKKYLLAPFAEEDSVENGSPTIIAEKMTQIEKLSVSEAVMQLDLLELPALIFINGSNDRINVVYYRKDGNIAWVDLPAL